MIALRFSDRSLTIRRVDYFSQLDDDDLSLNSGRRTADSANNNNNHLANLINNNSNGITLGPVIMKKSMTGDGSANSFNNRRKLPTNPPPKLRSTPLTPEKVTFDARMRHSATAPPTKKMQSLSVNSTSSRSSASSTSDTNSAKESVRHFASLIIENSQTYFLTLTIFLLLRQPKKKPITPPENCAACRICERFFNNDRIQKHEVICEKTASKKRKIFDATKHRVKVSPDINFLQFI